MACHCLWLHLISRVMTSIGLIGQLYRNSKMSNMNFYGTDVKWIFNSSCLNQEMALLDVPFGCPSCTVPSTNLKFYLFSLWDFCGWLAQVHVINHGHINKNNIFDQLEADKIVHTLDEISSSRIITLAGYFKSLVLINTMDRIVKRKDFSSLQNCLNICLNGKLQMGTAIDTF